MDLQSLLNSANQAAALGTDLSVAQVAERKLLPEGNALCRLVGVVELGDHAGEIKGVPYPPRPMVRLSFALYGEGYQSDDGKPATLSTYELTISNTAKAKAFKLFRRLNVKGNATSFAQLLGQAYVCTVVHSTAKSTGKVSAQLDLEGFIPAYDPVTKTPYNVPEPTSDMYKLFLWNMPTKEQWDSLFIEGTNDAGKSKNWIQDRILAAVNFPNSPLDMMLNGLGKVPNFTVPVQQPVAQAAPQPPVNAYAAASKGDLPVPPVAVPQVPDFSEDDIPF